MSAFGCIGRGSAAIPCQYQPEVGQLKLDHLLLDSLPRLEFPECQNAMRDHVWWRVAMELKTAVTAR